MLTFSVPVPQRPKEQRKIVHQYYDKLETLEQKIRQSKPAVTDALEVYNAVSHLGCEGSWDFLERWKRPMTQLTGAAERVDQAISTIDAEDALARTNNQQAKGVMEQDSAPKRLRDSLGAHVAARAAKKSRR